MAQTIKLKRSSTGGAVPSTSSLSLGEVAINTYDGKMYIKKNDGSDAIVEIGAGTSAVWKSYDYTATSSQTSFSGNDNNSDSLSYVAGFVQVFLNGILLDPAVDYTATTGSSIVLTSGASTGDLLQIESFTQIIGTGDILVDTFPVSSTQTAFTLSQDPVNKSNISVYVEGVYQESSTYSLSTTTLTLSESPANGTTVEVVIGTRNVTLDNIADLTISGTLHAGALDLGDANIINVNEISLDTIKGDADANTNITFAGSDVTTFTQGGTERLRLNTTGAQVTGNIVVSGTVDGRDVAADGVTADAALSRAGGAMGGAITTNSTFDGRDVSVDGTKLDGIESGATADQTDVEIRAAVESASDSNVFTNADHSKLDGIEALADVTDATNVTAAGALMDSEVTNLAQVKAFDSSDYATAAQGTTANAALPKAGGTMTGTLTTPTLITGAYGGSGSAGDGFRLNSTDLYGQIDSSDKVRLTVNGDSFLNGGNVGIGTSSPQSKLELNLATTSTSSTMNTNTVNDVQLIRAPFNASPHNTSGVGAKWGLRFVGRNDGTYDNTKSAAIYGVSEDTLGYNRQVGLAFHTSAFDAVNTERMRIDASGNVGIGTTSPSEKLHIHNGSIYVTPVSYASNQDDWALKIGAQNNAGWDFSGIKLRVNSSGGPRMSFMGVGQVEAMAIVGGNVGIGTTSPDYPLEVAGTTSTSIAYQRTGVSAKKWGFHTDNDNTYWQNITDNVLALTIKNNGNVGIGTTSPTTAKLEVAGTALVENAKLKAIAESNTDTAVDVFVYDTRKDSDGGAWRKRTQNTSWYNETLNTSTRGARKEFPSVAVIVAESTQLTIYDGDDPDMPMWMVFNVGPAQNIMGEVSLGCVSALNAILSVGSNNSGYDLNLVRFLSDDGHQYSTAGVACLYKGNIQQRNSGLDFNNTTALPNIINRKINDVAMTVLPNAPIDADTGLPVPTIAVATDGGVSVIKDDGSVVDITNGQDGSAFNYIDNLFFRKDGALVWVGDSSTNTAAERFVQVLHNLPNADTNQGTVEGSSVIDEQYGPSHKTGSKLRWATTAGVKATSDAGENFAVGTSGALHLIKYNREVEQEGSIAHITSDYNTGYMLGDIKLATLSDTDTTNAGAEIVTNGDFATDSDWSKGGGWTISGGKATHDSTTGNRYLNQGGILTAGKQYVLIFTISNYTSGVLRIYVAAQPIDITEGNTTYTIPFIATGTGDVNFQSSVSGAFIGSIDNVSCKLAEQDHSYNANGLQVFGTVTKTAVATGAELVAYSGFSASNYLKQNLDWTIGTGDFTFSFWVNPVAASGSYFHAISIGTESTGGQGSGNGIVLKLNASDSSPYFYTGAGGASQSTYNTNNALSAGTWSQLVCGRKSGVFYIYINGDLAQTGSSNSFSISDTVMTLGRGIGYGEYVGGSKLALVRISKTFPTAEQIAKIYNDEKHLFATNAKATLYGTSDAVTALAYDDDTELLHVGTSAGRSEFQGLNRVNNTTDAVSAAISASNGFIVED